MFSLQPPRHISTLPFASILTNLQHVRYPAHLRPGSELRPPLKQIPAVEPFPAPPVPIRGWGIAISSFRRTPPGMYFKPGGVLRS
jgi:hypothetical protein